MDSPEDKGPLDLFVIGGGVNGAGIACDATGRGLRVGSREAAQHRMESFACRDLIAGSRERRLDAANAGAEVVAPEDGELK